MATLLFFVEIMAVLFAACLFVGYGVIRNLLSEACGLVLDLFKTARAVSRTSASLASKLEADMKQQQVSQPAPAPIPTPKPASDVGDGKEVDGTIM